MKSYSRIAAFGLIGLIAGMLTAASAAAAPGDIDTSFGEGGVVAVPLGPTPLAPAVLQPDGKLIVADSGTSAASWRIRRYTTDGSPDFSFGTNFTGTVIVSFDVPFVFEKTVLGSDYPSGISVLNDGRFVIGGYSKVCGPSAPGSPALCEAAFIVARFNADGTLDPSFASGGELIVLRTGAYSGEITGLAVATQSDGKILGFRNSGPFDLDQPFRKPHLLRLNADGSPDDSFAPTISCVGDGVFRLTPAGKIVVITGSVGAYGICITQLNADGTPDTTFGNQGTSFVAAGAFGEVTDLFIDASGRIVVAGSLVLTTSTPTLVIFRLTQDGNLDENYGSGGIVAIGGGFFNTAVAGDCNNRTLVVLPNGGPVLIRRVLPDGSIDTSFIAFLADDAVLQLFVRPNGRILALAGQVLANQLNIIQYQGDLPCGTTTVAVEYYYADWNYYFESAFPDEIAALDGGAFGGAWQRTGETFNVWPQAYASASPTCRFFSTAFAPRSSHFYTPFPAECDSVKANPSWQFEAIAFYLQIPIGYGTGNGSCPQGTVALYRAYNNGMGGAPNHRYTTSLATLNTMLAQGWVFEGEANTRVFACVPQ